MEGLFGFSEWSALDELPLLHQPALVERRYEAIGDATGTPAKNGPRSVPSEGTASHQFVGVLERPPVDSQQRAVAQWTSDLKELLLKGESEFVNLLHRRALVQSEVHNNAMSSQQRRKRNRGRASKIDSSESSVPAILRLGVLTMFPLIEALSTVPGANYDRLCAQTLDIVIKTLSTLSPLALSKEPTDVLDAFKDFILRQIESNSFSIDSQAKSQALVALLSLVISQGQAQSVFQLLDVLFRVHATSKKVGVEGSLPVSAFIRNLVDHSRDLDVPVPLEALEDSLVLDLLLPSLAKYNPSPLASRQSEAFSFVSESQSAAALATDGKFLYIHSSHGLTKVGSGLQHTIRGHYYASNPSFRPADRWSSLVCIGDKLYYWSPELSYETYRPSKEESKPVNESGNPPVATGSPAPPRVCHVITILSVENLQPMKTIRIEDCSLSLQARMITDGKYLLFVGKQRGKGTKPLQQQQQQLQQMQQLQQQQQQGQPSLQQLLQLQPSSLSSGGYVPSFNPPPSFFSGDRPDLGSLSFGSFNPNGDAFQFRSSSPQPTSWTSSYQSAPVIPENPPVEEDLSESGSSDEDNSEEIEEEEANENENDEEESGSDEEVQEENEQLYNESERSPRRRSGNRSAIRASTRPKIKEEDYAVTNVVCVEWFDVSAPFAPALPSESTTAIPELANIPTIAPIRYLELPNRISLPTLAGLPQQSDELLPSTFGNISFYTNGHHLVAVCKNHSCAFRVFSLIDGKPSPDLPSSLQQGRLDARDSFAYHSLSDSIWAFRSESAKCSRYHNMGPAPFYSTELPNPNEMDVDVPASTSSASASSSKNAVFVFPQTPSPSPESMLANLDVWAGSPKKTRLVGVSKPSSVITERSLKDNLSPIECISVIIASLDRLARHHMAYSSHALVDDSFSTNMNDFNFTISPSVESLTYLHANLEHSLRFIKSGDNSVTLETSGSMVLSLLRLLKVNFHFFNTSGKTIKEEQRPLFNALLPLLIELSQGSNALGNALLEDSIRRAACDCICVGFFNLLPRSSLQIEFLKQITEQALEKRTPLHDKLSSTLAAYYRTHELLVDDNKVTMDVDQPESKPKKAASISSPGVLSSSGIAGKEKVDPRQGKELPFHPQAFQLLGLLVKKSLSDTTSQLDRIFSAQSVSDLKRTRLDEFSTNNSLRLLLALQMEIVSFTYAKGMVVGYFDIIARATEEFLVSLAKFPLDDPSPSLPSDQSSPEALSLALRRAQAKAANTLLQSSLIGTLLPSLLQAFSRRAHARDPAFVISVFDKLCSLLQCVDTFNQGFSMIIRVDQHLSARKTPIHKSLNESSDEMEFTGAWWLDLQCSLALLSRKCVVTLLEGEPTSEKERQCQDWLDTRLINGGIDENPQNVDKLRWLESFAEGKEGAALFNWIKSQGGSRPQARPTAKASLERAERYALAAMMKHAGLIDDAQAFNKALVAHAPLSTSHIGRFTFIAKKATSMASLLTRRAEMQKSWQLAVQDKVNDFDQFKELVQRPDRLYDFCEMHDVEPNPVNTEDTIKRLMQKLQEEIVLSETNKKSGPVSSSEFFDQLCAPIVERASFLLKLLPSNRTVKHPAADSSNPYSRSRGDAKSLRASAPGSKEFGGRGFLTKSMSQMPTTESAQEKIRQRESDMQDSESFSQRVGELRSWLQAYSEWEQTVLHHNRAKRDEPPPTSPIQGVIAFTTNHSITVKDWERVLRVQATRAKSREQGFLYLHRLLSTCHLAAPRHQLLGSLNVTHYLDGIQSSGQALTTRATELFGELFIALASIVKDTTLDSTSRLLALNVCSISYTEYDAPLLSKVDIFHLLQEVMSEPFSGKLVADVELLDIQRSQHRALKDAAWTCFRLFAAQVVNWRHYDDLHVERSMLTKLQQQAFDVYLLQLRTFSEKLVTHELSDWKREILVLEPHAGQDFAFELVFLLRLLSEASKTWTSGEAVPTLLRFLSSRTAPRAQRIVLRLLRKLLPVSDANQQLIQFCLDEMGKWIFNGKCNSSEIPIATAPINSKETTSMDNDKADSEHKPDTERLATLTILSSHSDPEQMIASGSLDTKTIDLLRLSQQSDSSTSRKSQASRFMAHEGRHHHRSSSQSRPLPMADTLRIAAVRAKFGDVLQVHEGDGAANYSAGAKGKNALITHSNPAFWADGSAAAMLASEYIALLRYLATPTNPQWLIAVRDTIRSAVSSLPALLSTISSNPERLSKDDSERLFRALSALCVFSGFPEPLRVGCKVTVTAPVVSQVELVTGTVVAYTSPSATADVILDSEAQDQPTIHTFDIKQLQAIPEIELSISNVSTIATSLIPSLLTIITSTSSLDKVPAAPTAPTTSDKPQESEKSSAMAVDAPPPESHSETAPSLYQNVWLYQELKAKSLCALDFILQNPDSVAFIVANCSESIPTLLQLAQKADPTTYLQKVERQLNSISKRLWDIQTIPGDLQGNSRRNVKGSSRGMSDALPFFWNANKAVALPTGLDKTSLAPGTVILDEDGCSIQLHGAPNSGHSGNFGRPSRGGMNRFGGGHKSEQQDVNFMFGNSLIPSKGLGQYYFEVYIHPDGTIEKPPGAPSKPHISIGLVPDPQTSGPTSASTSSASSYRQASYRGSSDVSMPFPPGSYCYLSTRNKAWVHEGNLRTDGYGEHFGYGAVVGCLWDQNERTIAFTKDGEELDIAFRNVLAASEGKQGNQDTLVPCVSASRGVQLTINFGQSPFRFSPELDDQLDAAAREAKKKEAEEKRQKAIQEEQAKRKAEQEQREAIFNEDASLLLSMGFCPRHCLRAMQHAGWTYKNRWSNQEGVLMAANWLTEASPDQLGPAGDLPSEAAPQVVEEAKPASSLTSSSSKKKPLAKSVPKEQPSETKYKKPVNPESEYPTNKSTEYILGDAYSLGAPRRNEVTLASVWRRDILPLLTSDIPFPANDPTVNQLIAYAEAGNEDALKSNLSDLYNGKIPAHIRLPSQLKIVQSENTQLKMTQITPEMLVQVTSAESGSALARFVGLSGVVLDRDLKHNLVLVQFVSSEDGTLEEWWFHVAQLGKDRSPTRPYSHLYDAASLHRLLASRTQQYAYIAARRVLLSLLRHAPLAFDVSRAKRDLDELAKAAHDGFGARMDVDVTPQASSSASSSSSAPIEATQTVSGAFDVQDAMQLFSHEHLTTPEILVSPEQIFTNSGSDLGMNFAGTKLVELLSRANQQQGADACAHLLNALRQKCIGLVDLASHFSNSKSVTFSHQDSAQSPAAPAPSGKSTKNKDSVAVNSPAPQSDGVTSLPNHLHKVHIPGARACVVIIHAETDRASRLNVYLDEDLTDLVQSVGGMSELEGSASYSAGGPFQPVLVPSNTFWVKVRPSTQAANTFAFGDMSSKVNLEYRVTVVPVSSDLALGRWIAEFLSFSTTTSELHVPFDFNPLLNSLIDFLYMSHVPSMLKESIMALLSRIIHELRRRARGQAHKLCQLVDPTGEPLDLSRLTMLKKEMISLYDNERRSANNSDNTAVKKRGSVFTTYLQSLVDLMISVRLYDIEKMGRLKLTQDSVPQSFNATGTPDEAMKAAVVLAQSLAAETLTPASKSNASKETEDDIISSSAFAMFSEEFLPEGPLKIPAEGEEDSSTTSSDASDEEGVKPSRLVDLFSSSGVVPVEPEKVPPSEPVEAPSNPEISDGGDEGAAWGLDGDMEIDDELAQAIAMSMRDQEESQKDEKKDDQVEKKPEEKVELKEEKKVEVNEAPQEPPKEDKPAEAKVEEKRPSSPPPKPAPASMDVDNASSSSSVPPPPPPPSSVKQAMSSILAGLTSPKTPEPISLRTPSNARKSTAPIIADPSWFATLVAAAQALENFSEQAESNCIPPVSSEAIASSSASSRIISQTSSAMQVDVPLNSHVDPLALQFTKDSIRTAWNNTRSQDHVRQRLFLLDHLPTVEADKRTELETAIEEVVEEKALVVDGSLYIPIDFATKRTKSWMILEVQSTDNMPSFFTFKDPNFTGNKAVRLEAIPIRRLLEKSSQSSNGTNSSNSTAPISAATSSSSSSSSSSTASKDKDLHWDEPDASLESQFAGLDDRWREYIRSRLWDKKSQHLTREFRNALTETFMRFCTDHTLDGVLGKKQLNELQLATGGDAISEDGFDFFFGFGTKTHSFVPRPLPHPGQSIFYAALSQLPATASTQTSQAPESSSNFKVPQGKASGTAEPRVAEKQAPQLPMQSETGLTLEAFLTMYTNQALQLPMTTFEELTNLGYDLHLNRTTFKTLEEAELAMIGNDALSSKSDLELVRYMEQLMSEVDLSGPLQLTVSHIKGISAESHLAQIFPRLVRLSMPLLCLRYEMLRQFNQKLNEVFPLLNMGSHSALSTWLSNCRGILFHSLKMNFVYNVLERTADDSSPCPSIILNRIDISANKDAVVAARTEELFTKKTAFGQAATQLANTDPAALRRPKPIGAEPHFSMRVLFQKENVQGDGGPYRQFFTDIAKELAEVLPLLVPCPNAQTKIGNNRDKFVVTPSCNSNTYLKMYRFLGQLMGMAMRTGVMLAIDLPSFFWKPLVGLAPTSQDIRNIDHSFHTVLKYLKTCTPDVFEGETRTIFDHFQTTLSDKSKMLLKAGGDQLEVTYENRLEYCRLAEAARCNESYLQILEIRRGLADFVPLSLLNLFTWQDLQWRVCGRPQIDLKLLKRHTEYAEGISPTSPHIRYFWQVLRSFSQEDRRAFVRFAWAQERLPADDQEFARSQTRMMIKQGPHSDQVFPTADTCFFNLSLPVYSSPEVLRERLLFAIHTDGAMDNDRPNNNDNEDR